MDIIWKYLDKRKASISALKDFSNMKFIINNTDEKIKEEYQSISSVNSYNFDIIKVKNSHSFEDRVVNGIEKIDILKARYRCAKDYIEWFMPAWEELNDDERYILEKFYLDEKSIYDICEHFNIERSSAYNKKNRAVEKLSTLLYGK
jgi:DNA-directed RNA polymerase specialized sigma subunit